MFGNNEKLLFEIIQEMGETIHILVNNLIFHQGHHVPPHHNHHTATKLQVVSISIDNNTKIEGNIMKVTFKRAQKVVATIAGANATNPAAPITGLGATSGNTSIFTIGAVDQLAQTVELLGVSDGDANVIYTAKNDKNVDLTLTDQVSISDVVPPPDTTATALVSSYSAPVDQVPASLRR